MGIREQCKQIHWPYFSVRVYYLDLDLKRQTLGTVLPFLQKSLQLISLTLFFPQA